MVIFRIKPEKMQTRINKKECINVTKMKKRKNEKKKFSCSINKDFDLNNINIEECKEVNVMSKDRQDVDTIMGEKQKKEIKLKMQQFSDEQLVQLTKDYLNTTDSKKLYEKWKMSEEEIINIVDEFIPRFPKDKIPGILNKEIGNELTREITSDRRSGKMG